jgi:hypothetical protein
LGKFNRFKSFSAGCGTGFENNSLAKSRDKIYNNDNWGLQKRGTK